VIEEVPSAPWPPERVGNGVLLCFAPDLFARTSYYLVRGFAV